MSLGDDGGNNDVEDDDANNDSDDEVDSVVVCRMASVGFVTGGENSNSHSFGGIGPRELHCI